MSELPVPRGPMGRLRWADVGAYVLTVAVAIASGWGPADLVWGVWITGLVGTLFTIGIPWVLLTAFPGLDPATTPERRSHEAGQWRRSLFFLGVFWGSVLLMYGFAGLFLLDLVPLPGEVSDRGVVAALVQLLGVCLTAYWAMVVVNGPVELWRVWTAIRSGSGSPTNPFVSVGRVMVAGTAMVLFHFLRIDSVAVALLLFLYYLPEEVFAERVLGMR